MNLFSRAAGGILSDYCNSWFGIAGRIRLQVTLFLLEGTALVIFALQTQLSLSITTVIFLGIFTDAACGSHYGLTSYPMPDSIGTVSGVIGAGGIAGALKPLVTSSPSTQPISELRCILWELSFSRVPS
jgi:NNP family nitrate/nitrite transporter-like MFS transporter